MAFKVVLTEIANDELAALVHDSARDKPIAAECFGLALLKKIKVLGEQPMLGRMVPERGDPNLREIIHRPYRIVYRIHEREQRVEVLRFWHGAQDHIDIPQ